MSVKDFLEKLNADKKLQEEFVETQLVPFAKKNGFDLTAKDFELFWASIGKDAGVSGGWGRGWRDDWPFYNKQD